LQNIILLLYLRPSEGSYSVSRTTVNTVEDSCYMQATIVPKAIAEAARCPNVDFKQVFVSMEQAYF